MKPNDPGSHCACLGQQCMSSDVQWVTHLSCQPQQGHQHVLEKAAYPVLLAEILPEFII